MWLHLLLLALTLAVVWIRRRYSYWKDHGIPYVKPNFPTGNLNRKVHISTAMQKCYKQLKRSGPFGGIFFFINPVALALDLDFVKNVLVKDFQYFHDRSLYYNEKADPLSAHLVAMEGTKWKNLRAKLTPTFTSGKMKMMFPTIVGVADEFRKLMTAESQKGEVIEMKDILARFTTDVIGTCAFGLECNSLHDPEAEFRQMGRKVFNLGPWRFFVTLLAQQFRSVARILGIKMIDPEVSQFFMGAVKDTVDYRRKNKVERNDFMSLLLKIGSSDESGNSSEALTLNEISAQAFVFFGAGFETSSTTMSYCLYELALNTDLQEKARQDVLDSIKRHGSMSYEAVQDMHYIDQCINESLRKYPPLPVLFRIVTKDYKVPNNSMVLKEGTTLVFPVHSIQHDPEYYPNPERYDPDRFSPAEVAKRNPYSFLSFGEGPRNCIGMMQARVGMATLLKDFRFTLSSRTPVPLQINSNNFVLTSEGGLWLHVEKI